MKKAPLGLTTLTGLVIANMVGAGVFVTSGFALADLGSPKRVMLAWVCGGIIALCGALSYGGLVKRLTESGGEYLFLARVYHPLVGFIAGWVSLLAGFTGAIALAALTAESYLPGQFSHLPQGLPAYALVVFAALVHGIRLRSGAISQNISVFLKLGLIVLFVGYAVFFATSPPQAATLPVVTPFSLSAFAGSLVWISLSFSGFNAAVYVAGEAHQPKRNVPRALWMGTAVVTLIYLALNWVFVCLAPFDKVVGREDVAAAAALALGGSQLAIFVRTLILLALITSVLSMMMAGPRVYARMADDGLFPKALSFRGEIPRVAIAIQALLAMTVIYFFSDLKQLLSFLGFTLSLCSALAVSALFLLRHREGPKAIPVIGYPFTPIIYVAATLVFAALSAQREPWQLVAALVTVLTGCIAFVIFKRK